MYDSAINHFACTGVDPPRKHPPHTLSINRARALAKIDDKNTGTKFNLRLLIPISSQHDVADNSSLCSVVASHASGESDIGSGIGIKYRILKLIAKRMHLNRLMAASDRMKTDRRRRTHYE